MPKGSYTYIFTLEKNGQELMQVEVPIKVESLADRYAQLNSIKEGTQEIDITNRQFYKFEPEVSGDYMISAKTGLSYLVIEVKEDGTTERLNETNGRVLCKLEQDHKYIIDIYNDTPYATSTNLTLKRLAKTESVEIISYMPQEIKCIEGQKPKFNFIKVRINVKWEQRKGKSIFYSKSNKDFPELTVLSATQDKGMIPRSSTGIDIKYKKRA